MALHHSPNIVTNGLVLALDASDPKSYSGSGTTWFDRSGNGYNATLNNSPTISNGRVSFNGTNNSATISSLNLSNTASITLSFWCKLNRYNEINGGFDGILCEFSTNFNNTSTGFYIGIADDSTNSFADTYPISINIRGNTGYNIHGYNKNAVNDLQWHYWTCILDKTVSGTNPIESKFYVDAVERPVTTFVDSSFRQDNTNNFGTNPFYIIGRGGTTFLTNPTLGPFHIYNRALSASEIAQNFNATKGRFGL